MNIFEKQSPHETVENSAVAKFNTRIDSFMRDFIKHPYWCTDNDPPDLEVVTSKSDRRWYRNGVLHRDGAPAIVGHNGAHAYEEWYQNGLRHREDGPAVRNGMFEKWYRHGKLHREDGPAKFRGDIYAGVYVYTKWFRDGKLHRDDGPAVESLGRGYRRWYRHGKLHREDGPAIEELPFVREYWVDGKPHRMDGPAVIRKQEFLEAWYVNGQLHRDDGPAVCKGDTEVWSWRGRLHREDGPAIIIGWQENFSQFFANNLRWSRQKFNRMRLTRGEKQYWVLGERFSEEAYQRYLARKAAETNIKD